MSATPATVGSDEDRVADELAGAVVGDVAAAVGLHQLGADLGRRHEQVAQVGPHAERVDVRVLEQQQVVVGASVAWSPVCRAWASR